MRVLTLGWELPPRIAGGLGTACLALSRALAAEGARLTFVVPQRHGDEPADHMELVGARDATGRADPRLLRRRVPAALAPYERPRPPGAPAAGRPYGHDLFAQVRRYGRAVGRLAKPGAFDVVHAHDWMTFRAGAQAAAAIGCPLVVHVHSLEHDRAPRGPDPRLLAAEQAGVDAAAAVVCVSRFTAARLERFYRVERARLHVVHNALPDLPDPASAPPRPVRARSRPVVLFLGRVTAQKGPEVLLAAARRVVESLPAAKVVVAGDGDLWRSTVERAAALGLTRHVAFTGFLGAADVERAYAQADVFVLPSVAEPFGLTALEAAARGVPVVLTRQSGAAEVLPSAPAVDAWDVEGLAAEVLALLTDRARHARLAGRLQAEARALTWAGAARRLLALFRGLSA